MFLPGLPMRLGAQGPGSASAAFSVCKWAAGLEVGGARTWNWCLCRILKLTHWGLALPLRCADPKDFMVVYALFCIPMGCPCGWQRPNTQAIFHCLSHRGKLDSKWRNWNLNQHSYGMPAPQIKVYRIILQSHHPILVSKCV